jgi:hypothetical protein
MKGFLLTLFAVVLFTGLAAQPLLTSYQVQYTEDMAPSGGASSYNGQTVIVEGIVVAEKYYTASSTSNYGFYISDDVAGPFSGLFVFTNQYHPARGDRVKCYGTVTEYNGLTELFSISNVEVLSQGNPLPAPMILNTGQLIAADAEKWEGVFARVENVTITSAPSASYGEFMVNDSSGACQVDDQCFPRGYVWTGINTGDTWVRIQGVVDYGFGYYGLNPRDSADMIKTESLANSQIQIETTNSTINTQTSVNVLTTKVKPDWGVQSYDFSFTIDPSLVLFKGLDIAGTITTEMPTYTISPSGAIITCSVAPQGGIISTDDAILIKLLFEPIAYGEAAIDLTEFFYNDEQINNLNDGRLITKIQSKIAYLNIGKAGDKKNIFNPYLNEKLIITYGVKTGYLAKAVVRIYDAQGRLVYTPVHTNVTSSTGIQSFNWDGRDSSMNLLPVGMYYCHLEISDRSTGESERTVQPIVIKSTLK